MDGQYSMYVYGPPALLAVAAIVVGLFAYELARGRLVVPRRQGVLLVGILVLGLGELLLVVREVGRPGGAPWDETLSIGLRGAFGPLHGVAAAASWLLSFPFALLALFLLFLWPAKKLRWKEAYFALAAGPGLAAVLVVLKVVFPRFGPPQPFFVGATTFPNDIAALVPMAAMLAAFLLGRLRPAARGVVPYLVGLAILGVLFPVVAGFASAADVIAGVSLAALWFAVCLMALHLAEGGLQGSPLQRALDRIDSWAQRVMERPIPWLVGLIVFGIALRIASYWWTPLAVDAFSYSAMSHSFLQDGSFTMPWGDVDTYHTAAVQSHHYPPLYPLYLASFFSVFGFTQSTAHIASIVSSLAALLVVYLCTRDMYGHVRGLIATAVAAVSPILVQNTGQGYSENLVLLLFVATMWAILKSLEKPWYIVPAGILAGLGYLTKSTMGPFFIIAGLGGLAWRLHWKGWKVLRDPAYLTAVACFGFLVAIWAWRNILLFGTWDTSFHITDAYHAALTHPLQWAYLFLVTFVFYATVGYLVYLAILPWLPKLVKIPKLQSEHDSGLWLALGLPLLLTAAIDACLWLVEKEFFVNNVRYVAFVAIPAVWLIMRHASPKERGVRLAAVFTIGLLVVGSVYFAKPTESYTQDLADDLAPRLQAGDSVGFVDNNNHFAYRFYFQLTHNGERDVPVVIACMKHPLCPADIPRVGDLDTTWVLLPHYAESELNQTRYHQVTDTMAQFDGQHETLMTLWRHR